jgi:hypothetical protein
MSTSPSIDRDAFIAEEVEKALEKYKGLGLSPRMLALLRRAGEDYYRLHPQAVDIVNRLTRTVPERSGDGPTGEAPDAKDPIDEDEGRRSNK